MKYLITALRAYDIQVEDKPELRDQVKAMGIDPDSMTAPQAKSIAEAIAASLKNGSALATATATAPTATKGGKVGKGRRNAPADEFAESVKAVVKTSLTEVDQGIIAPVAQFADGISTKSATEAVDILRNIPADTLSKFVQLAQEEQAQPERFRSLTEGILSGFSVGLSLDAAE